MLYCGGKSILTLIMAKLKDFTTDNNPKYLYLAGLHHPFPEWVSSVQVPSQESFEKMASTAFGDPERRLLPVSDRVATFHSALNVFANMEDYTDEVFYRVKSACTTHGIDDDVLPYIQLFAEEMSKSASADETTYGKFAIDMELNDQHFRLLPINSVDEIEDSARDLTKMAGEGRIHYLQLVEASKAIFKEAAEYATEDLPALIYRLGLDRYEDPEKAAAKIVGREKSILDPAMKKSAKISYDSAIREMQEGTITPQDAMEKIAATDDLCGVKQRLDSHGDGYLPHEIVFSGPLKSLVEKEASENVLLRDILIPREAFASLDAKELEFKLSKSASEQLNKIKGEPDAKDLSLTLGQWGEDDQKTLLRILATS